MTKHYRRCNFGLLLNAIIVFSLFISGTSFHSSSNNVVQTYQNTITKKRFFKNQYQVDNLIRSGPSIPIKMTTSTGTTISADDSNTKNSSWRTWFGSGSDFILTNKINLSLMIAYATIGSGLSLCAVPFGLLHVEKLQLLFMGLWLGFVLSISFMEAWLKFRAPFVPKYLALDIGRHIFPALNSVEVAFCFCQWFLLFLRHYHNLDNPVRFTYYVGLLTSILMLDVLYYTPRLVLHGKIIVLANVKDDYDKNSNALSAEQKKIVDTLVRETRGRQKVKRSDHITYVVLEFIKVVIGLAFAWNLMKN